jgi:hypothetical protein
MLTYQFLKRLPLVTVLLGIVGLTGCKKQEGDPLVAPTSNSDLYDTWMYVNDQLWTTRSAAATYDTTLGVLTLELTRATTANAREKLIITYSGPLQTGVNGQFALNVNASYSPAPGREANATQFDLHIVRYENGKLWARFWGRMQEATGEVYTITDGNIENLLVAVTGYTGLNTDGSFYAQTSFGNWQAELKSASFQNNVLRIQGLKGHYGNTDGFVITLPLTQGQTGTFTLGSVAGMGGNYNHYQFGPHYWTNGELTVLEFTDSTVSGIFHGLYSNPFTGVQVSVTSGVFQLLRINAD